MAAYPVYTPRKTLVRNILSLLNADSSRSHLLQIHCHLLRTYLILDIFACNTILRAYAQAISHGKSLTFYNHMRRLGVRSNSFSSSFILKSCVKVSSLINGQQVHGRILQDGHQSDSVLLTSLMVLYSSSRDLGSVRKVFDEMTNRDTFSWNVLISSYASNNLTKDALLLFDAMQSPEFGAEPDAITCLILLQACANLGALDFGERIHKYVDNHGYGNLLNIRNSLIVMYSKSGSMDKAYRVFSDMPERNVVTWSTMITKFAPPKVPGVDDVTGEPLIQRKDDTAAVLKSRLEAFHRQTEPVIGYYSKKGAVANLHADKPPEEVTKEVKKVLS